MCVPISSESAKIIKVGRTFCHDVWILKILRFLLQWKVSCDFSDNFQQFPFENTMHLIIGKGIMVSIKAVTIERLL